ncbi:uracil-DNA glycosylase-like isoform X1 [Tachypleus tridentatus]|uniref:uracil-DNA glycosylase-like isoform X1 n=1 Tax=Tachypleus tridentatus TaxID=6853 RepID=UPI003FD288D7
MIGQRKILLYFKPENNKRKSTIEVVHVEKRLRTAFSAEEVQSSAKQLSSAQLKQLEKNKLQAKVKLQAKKTSALWSSIGLSWYKALETEFTEEYFQKVLSKFLENERKKYTIYPPEDQVYLWTKMCEIDEVKVVILGQDPYHGQNQAHGLAFSVQEGVARPPSLINIYKELESDIPGFTAPLHGNLTGWARQGVLLLNACLTVRAQHPNSHKDQGWESLTDAVIKWLSCNLSDIVFFLWGSYAQKKGAVIDKKKHLVLNSVHPSPLSASRGFFGCHHFSKANQYLVQKGKKPIDWNYLPIKEE